DYHYRAPQWSPNGKRLAWLGCGWGWENRLYVRTLAGTRPEQTTSRFDRYDDVGFPAWSPDGRYLTFRHGILRGITADRVETIKLIEPGGQSSRTVFSMAPVRFEAIQNATTPRPPDDRNPPPDVVLRICGVGWPPDGNRIAVAIASEIGKPETCALWI